MRLVYDKAVMEPHFAPMYAKLCRWMNSNYSHCVETLLYTKSDDANPSMFVCCEQGQTIPLCAPDVSKDHAKEALLKRLTVRNVLAQFCKQVSQAGRAPLRNSSRKTPPTSWRRSATS